MKKEHAFIAVIGAFGIVLLFIAFTWTPDRPSPVQRTQLQNLESSPRFIAGERRVAEELRLPLPDSAPTLNVPHTIPIEEIRRGCFRQDCIPSVEDPEFVPARDLAEVLEPDSLGIRLRYKEEERYYPFPMLETREIVNDFVANDPLLITYCPLCGTGIVFRREIDGTVFEFGVSGMLWQSNLLMYNRSTNERDRNLWSQVLGQAVVGDRAGDQLEIIPSDIVQFQDWLNANPSGQTLFTGSPRDPYNGDYFGVASNFAPNFDEATSPLAPDTYVYGILVNENPRAYPRDQIPIGDTLDEFAGETVRISRSADGTVQFVLVNSDELIPPTRVPDVEGFWFSWVAAHPESSIWGIE